MLITKSQPHCCGSVKKRPPSNHRITPPAPVPAPVRRFQLRTWEQKLPNVGIPDTSFPVKLTYAICSMHLKIDSWKTTFLFGGNFDLFRGYEGNINNMNYIHPSDFVHQFTTSDFRVKGKTLLKNFQFWPNKTTADSRISGGKKGSSIGIILWKKKIITIRDNKAISIIV